MSFSHLQTPDNINDVRFTGGSLKNRQQIALDSTIPATMEKTIETGRLDAFKLDWKPGMPKEPHVFWDSDTAKVLEGMAAALSLRPDEKLEAEYDRWVDLIVSAQQPDGYLNTHFTVVEPGKRFTNLCYLHELYCCGHLIEAAVVGYTLLGKRKLLDCMCRYADFLVGYFGTGKHRGWPGHEEIELALYKLYRVTGKKDYLDLAIYFVNDRGTSPNFFTEEEKTLKSDPKYFQAHMPVRDQKTAEGHSVRCLYLFSGVADLANETEDASLLDACKAIFENVRNRRMYVTGGIGSTFAGEAFTVDYDLTNGSLMYAESCAAIALSLFCQRMMNITGEEKYAAVLEQALFNGILSGIGLSGDEYFYTNYLEVDDNLNLYNMGEPIRQKWFDCSCCPTNFARYLTQMQQFVVSVNDTENEIRLQIPVDTEICHAFADGTKAHLKVAGGYPYNGTIKLTVKEAGNYTVSLRIPEWCRKASIKQNDREIWNGKGGCYVPVKQNWKSGDTLELQLDMPIDFVRCNDKVTVNVGRIAVRRGPVVYCVESKRMAGDAEVRNFRVDTARTPELTDASGLPGFVKGIRLFGELEKSADPNALYFVGAPSFEPCEAIAIPYALWNNNGKTNMAIWIRAF